LFLRALQSASRIDPGFDTRGVELAALDLSLAGYTEDTGHVFASDLLERVRALPGVRAAALAALLPLGNSGMGLGGLSVPGVTPPNGRRSFDLDWNIVSPGYFDAMRMRLISGRDFTDADRANTPFVAIINETAARMFFPGQNPIGKAVMQDAGTRASPDATRTLTVVAVARDTKDRSLSEDPRAFIYVPFQQQYRSRTTIVARSTSGQRLTSEIRALVASMNTNLPIVTAQTFEDYASLDLTAQRIAASVSGSLGLVGLLLATIGIYGVTSFMVSSRTREIGIRMALGAQRRDVVRMVLLQGMKLVGIGTLVGLALAAAASQVIASLLMGVAPTDAITFAGAVALFIAIGIAACYVPARRAVQINATEALRYE